jgi:glycosyltransferase involved in cell wall biosynthesis
MTRVAFYAPLKSPDHPVPSGDRQMARGLMQALELATGGPVDLMSDLRSHEARGDPERQAALMEQARAEVARLTQDMASGGYDLWVTYHNYYKAPDLIGPKVCAALGLPYVLIESTRARKRLTGPWAEFAAQAEAASDAADVIFYLTQHDRDTLERDRPDGQELIHLRPFLARTDLPAQSDVTVSKTILSAGMMRRGDKLSSYQIIAETLPLMAQTGWTLSIAGDGPARSEVEALFAPFGRQVRFLGQLGPDALQAAYAEAALFFWPGVNEAFGMVYLEAQAAGLPVVAQDRPGVRDVVAGPAGPPPENGPQALAHHMDRLLKDPDARRTTGQAGRDRIAENHLLGAAADQLNSGIAPLIGHRS